MEWAASPSPAVPSAGSSIKVVCAEPCEPCEAPECPCQCPTKVRRRATLVWAVSGLLKLCTATHLPPQILKDPSTSLPGSSITVATGAAACTRGGGGRAAGAVDGCTDMRSQPRLLLQVCTACTLCIAAPPCSARLRMPPGPSPLCFPLHPSLHEVVKPAVVVVPKKESAIKVICAQPCEPCEAPECPCQCPTKVRRRATLVWAVSGLLKLCTATHLPPQILKDPSTSLPGSSITVATGAAACTRGGGGRAAGAVDGCTDMRSQPRLLLQVCTACTLCIAAPPCSARLRMPPGPSPLCFPLHPSLHEVVKPAVVVVPKKESAIKVICAQPCEPCEAPECPCQCPVKVGRGKHTALHTACSASAPALPLAQHPCAPCALCPMRAAQRRCWSVSPAGMVRTPPYRAPPPPPPTPTHTLIKGHQAGGGCEACGEAGSGCQAGEKPVRRWHCSR